MCSGSGTTVGNLAYLTALNHDEMIESAGKSVHGRELLGLTQGVLSSASSNGEGPIAIIVKFSSVYSKNRPEKVSRFLL